MSECTPPKHILLATDLSARCDRAQDRSLDLARAWQARLTAVHAIEAEVASADKEQKQRIAAAERRASRQLQYDLAAVTDIGCSYEIRKGRPAEVVLDVVREQGCDLVVTGIARNDPFGNLLLGGMAGAVVRKARTPVLVVKKRTRSRYRRVVIASDLSDASVPALQAAIGWFGSTDLTLFHAVHIPFRGFGDMPESYEADVARQARKDVRAFLDVQAQEEGKKIGIEVAGGDAAPSLAEYAATQEVDLVVAGTHGRTGLLNVLLGSVAEALLEQVGCDVMIVPSTRSTG